MAPCLLELSDWPLSAALDGGQGWTSDTSPGRLGVNYMQCRLCFRRIITSHDNMSTKLVAGLNNKVVYELHFSLFMNGHV